MIAWRSVHRISAPLVAALLSCSCAGLSTHWEKEGADQAVLQRDLNDCRTAARDEAMRTWYPGPGPLFVGPRHFMAWEQYSDSQRFYAEGNLTRFCMRNKGYELVPDQGSTPAATKARATPSGG